MSVVARMKGIAGGQAQRTLASATTIVIDESGTNFLVTGTTAITYINFPYCIPNRIIRLIGGTATGPALTDTALASAAFTTALGGTISTHGARTIGLGEVITLRQDPSGYWVEVNYSDTIG